MKYYIVREIAALLQVSKPTVQKAIKSKGITCDFIKDNRQYFNEASTIAIIKTVKPEIELANLPIKLENSPSEAAKETANSENKLENSPINTENLQNETANSPTAQEKEAAALYRMIDLLEKQLSEQSEQLKVKDKQIQDLSNRLAEAMQLTNQQQYLTAASSTTEIKEADSFEDIAAVDLQRTVPDQTAAKETVQTKTSFWSWLFRR